MTHCELYNNNKNILRHPDWLMYWLVFVHRHQFAYTLAEQHEATTTKHHARTHAHTHTHARSLARSLTHSLTHFAVVFY